MDGMVLSIQNGMMVTMIQMMMLKTWVGKIVFQKKQYHLGKYDTIEEADLEWAKANPVKIMVEKIRQ